MDETTKKESPAKTTLESSIQIPLTQGKYATVDKEDFDKLNKFKWFARKDTRSGKYYAIRNYRIAKNIRKTILMHNIIMVTPKGFDTDHKNGETLDNRKVNLRITTHHQNIMNRGKYKTNTSGYVGVIWDKKQKSWVAQMGINGKHKWLGYFDTAHQAAMARDLWAFDIRGEYAQLNFERAI